MIWKDILKAAWQTHNKDAIFSFTSGLSNTSLNQISDGFSSAGTVYNKLNNNAQTELAEEYIKIIQQIRQLVYPSTGQKPDWGQLEQKIKPLIGQLEQFERDNPPNQYTRDRGF